jgi:hypothetical protein
MTSATGHLLDVLSLDATRFGDASARALPVDEWQAMVALASALGVPGPLATRLHERGLTAYVPPDCQSALRRASRLVAIKNLRVHADLRIVVDALHARQIDVIVLKGPRLTASVYRNMSDRLTSDLDLLVRWKDLSAAGKTIEALGYHPATPYEVDDRLDPYLGHQLPKFSKRGTTPVEIHRTIGLTDRIDVEGLWTRAVPERIADRDVLVLSPEDFIVHLCGHAGHQHGFECGARPLCDIAATIRHSRNLDWSAVVSRSRAWGWARANALILQLTKELVGGDVPDHVLTDLCPDAVPATLRDTALRLLTAGTPEEQTLHNANRGVVSLSTQGILGKLQLFLKAAFLSRTEMARRYPVSPTSPRLLAYYPVRFADVIRRHWRLTLRLHGHDAGLSQMVREKAALLAWLEE